MNKSIFLIGFLAGCGFLSKEEDEGDEEKYGSSLEEEESNYSTDHECNFTRISGTKMSSYDCNPVFGNTGEAWADQLGSIGFYSSSMLGHMMWYTSKPEGEPYGMGLATSSNGSDWTISEENPLLQSEEGAWDQDSLSGQAVVWDDVEAEYVMLYQGFTLGTGEIDPETFEQDNGTWGMGVATSDDGISWSKSEANPVIDFNDGFGFEEGFVICWPLTLAQTSRGFRGYIAASAIEIGEESKCEIYAIDGFDSTHWFVDQSAPVMAAGADYDSMGMTGASIVDVDGILYMFYIGFTEWIQYNGYQTAANLSLNLATSMDGGGTWNRDANNPLPIENPYTISAQLVNERIHLWVKNEDNELDYYFFNPNIEDHE